MVRREGGSRVLSIREIPADWLAVDLTVTKKTPKQLIIKIDKVK